MSDDCIDVERIPEVSELPVDDPRRRHVETCPRCSAILASYRAFIREEFVAGSDPDNANERLTAFVASEFGTPRERVDFAFGPKAPGLKGFLSRATASFFLRPVWITALLVIIAAGLLWWSPWTPEPIMLRGALHKVSSQPLALSAPQRLPEGGIRLQWTPMAGADTYQVRFYDKGLKEIARLEPTSGTTLVIDRSMLPAGAPTALMWRIVAFQRGDEIGSSDPASVDLR